MTINFEKSDSVFFQHSADLGRAGLTYVQNYGNPDDGETAWRVDGEWGINWNAEGVSVVDSDGCPVGTRFTDFRDALRSALLQYTRGGK